MLGTTELIETEFLRQSLQCERLLGQYRGYSVWRLAALGRVQQSVFLNLAQLILQFFDGESGLCRLCLPAYALPQRDAQHAIEGMDTNLLVGPVIHRFPAEPVAVLESAKDLFDMLLSEIGGDDLLLSAVQLRWLVTRTVRPSLLAISCSRA